MDTRFNTLTLLFWLTALTVVSGTAEAGELLPSTKGVEPGTCTLPTACGENEFGVLGNPNCEISPGTWVTFWEFEGTAGQEVSLRVSSTEFDTFLDLFAPGEVHVASDDDGGGPGPLDSRIDHTLDRTGLWKARVSNFPESALGDGSYELTLECSGGPQEPAAPSNLTATALDDTKISLEWRDNSNNEEGFVVQEMEEGGSFESLGVTEPGETDALIGGLRPSTTYSYRVAAVNSNGVSAFSNVATATTRPAGQGCTPSELNLCLLDNRFRVEVEWTDFEFDHGPGRVVELGPFASSDSGLFWFFDSENWEMLVKMVDACNSPFESFWVFSAATTDVEYTLRITDTETGVVREYFNPLGNAAAATTDTGAFRTCR